MDSVFTFDKHSKEPENTFDQYLREKKLELGRSLKNLKKIYLDTNFWLILRDASLDRVKQTEHKELLEIISDLTRKKIIICPICEDVFDEMIKQTDEITLKATIDLIDKLSTGVTLVSHEERWQTEVFHFIRSSVCGESSCHPIDEFVWVKLAYTHGIQKPYNEYLSSEENNLLQKTFLDKMWSISLADKFDVVGANGFKKYPHIPDFSHILNEEKKNYHKENSSFKKIFLSEVAFILDFKKDFFLELFKQLYREHFKKEPVREEVEKSQAGQQVTNLIYHSFRLGKIERKLPSFDIEAGLHTQIIHDLMRRYKPNDIHDINHAIAALPYCDVFLTEKNLKALITRKNLDYAKKYDCNVITEVKEAICCLRQINN